MSLKPWWTLCCLPFIVITVKHFQRRKAFPRSAALKKKKKQKSKPRRHLHTTETTTIVLALWHITWSCGWNQVFLPFPSCTSPAQEAALSWDGQLFVHSLSFCNHSTTRCRNFRPEVFKAEEPWFQTTAVATLLYKSSFEISRLLL